MNREVNLTKRVQTAKGLSYCPVILSANRRVKPDAVLVNGEPERHTKAPIIWSGLKARSGYACQSVKTQRTPMHEGDARPPNSTP